MSSGQLFRQRVYVSVQPDAPRPRRDCKTPMETLFTPEKKEKISSLIVRQIRSAIMQGKLKTGEALPPEKELIAQFGVSKHTLREALRALEGMGLIFIRRGAGGGPVVSPVDWETARDSFSDFLHFQDFSLAHLSEVRKIIEPYVARRATEVFTPEAEAELLALHAECRRLHEEGKSLVGAEAEIMFHVLLGKHVGNPVLWVMLDFVNNMLAKAKQKMQPGADFCLMVLNGHQRIVDAILAKDPAGAEHWMRVHILEVEQELERLHQQAKS